LVNHGDHPGDDFWVSPQALGKTPIFYHSNSTIGGISTIPKWVVVIIVLPTLVEIDMEIIAIHHL